MVRVHSGLPFSVLRIWQFLPVLIGAGTAFALPPMKRILRPHTRTRCLLCAISANLL